MPTPVKPHFGRLVAPDANDKKFLMRAALKEIDVGPPKVWSLHRSMQHKQEGGTCVGHGWLHMLAASPYRHAVDHAVAYAIYNRAQQIDEWADTPPQEGTSVRAGAKAAVEMGLLEGSYVWAFTEKDLQAWTGRGPVTIGVVWLTGMMKTDSDGFVNLTGGEEGGHCVCVLGYSKSMDSYRFAQSWGLDWGDQGRGWIHRADMRALIEDLGGEACAAMEVAPRKAVPGIIQELQRTPSIVQAPAAKSGGFRYTEQEIERIIGRPLAEMERDIAREIVRQ